MKLTIGMIVKNEEKWLEKCLTAITPILDNVDSELIITDTGSTDRTVEIAKQFTDKILHFDWIGDFAAARNHGLKEAKGEWFMYIDADQVFLSCDPVIKFFNSGEYHHYNAASITANNYFKTDKGVASEEFAEIRLVKLNRNTRFEGIIHERINDLRPPFKNLRVLVDHYGYLYEDEAQRRKKFERNAELLLKEYKENDNKDIMLYVQIYQVYSMIKEDETALKYLNEGIDFGKKTNSFGVVAVICHKAEYYFYKKDYHETISVCDDYFSLNKTIRPGVLTTDAEMYALKASSLYMLEEYPEAIDSFKLALDCFRDVESGKVLTPDVYLVSYCICTRTYYLHLFADYMESCIRADKFNTAENCMTTFPLYKYCIETYDIARLVNIETTVLDHFGYKNISDYAKQLDDRGKELLSELMIIRLYNTKCDKQIFDAVSALGGTAQKNHDEAALLKAYFDGTADPDLLSETAKTIIGCAIHSTEINRIRNNDLLTVGYDALFADLAKIYDSYIKCHGSEDVPDIIAASGNVSKIHELHVNKRYKECIAEIKHTVETYQPLAPIMSEYSRVVLDEYEKAAKATQPQNEMQALAAAIKKNIRAFIAEGNIDAARKTLNDYRQIAPNDPEIAELMNELN